MRRERRKRRERGRLEKGERRKGERERGGRGRKGEIKKEGGKRKEGRVLLSSNKAALPPFSNKTALLRAGRSTPGKCVPPTAPSAAARPAATRGPGPGPGLGPGCDSMDGDGMGMGWGWAGADEAVGQQGGGSCFGVLTSREMEEAFSF